MGEIFVFKCKTCGKKFEMFHLISEPVHEVVCPECGGTEAVRIASHEHKGALPMTKTGKKTEEDETKEE